MKKLVKNLNNLIKRTIFKVQIKTTLFKVQIKINNKLLISKFSNLFKTTIFKGQNQIITFENQVKKINKLLISKFSNLITKTISQNQNQITIFKDRIKKNNKLSITKFNNLIKKTIFKIENQTSDKLLFFKGQHKTNNKLLISKFNKYLITLICILFFYLFYLSIPVLYEKNWVQKNIENQLLKDFKIHFSLSSDISYRILPSPHYLIKDSKIIKENDKTISLAEIKNLKIFISQKNFLKKKKLSLRNIKIDNADFKLSTNDFKLLKNSINNKFSNKKIEINKGNVFFKNDLDEIITIIKISQGLLFHDDKKLLNLFNLEGEVFNIPFNFDYNKKFNSLNKEEINITAKRLKLGILNIHNPGEKNESKGENTILLSNSKIITNYKRENDIMIFNSTNSRIKNSKISYKGEVSINPFDLKLNINLGNYDLNKFFNPNSILNELIKTELLINDNISMNTLISIGPNLKNKIFQNGIINFNIIDGKLNINKTRLINNKIGMLELENSNLSYENNRLILNTDILVNVKNYNKLYSLLQTNKKFRRPITDILINLDYDFLSKKVNFNNIKINNHQTNDELLRIIDGFNDSDSINWNKSKRILNTFFEAYEG